jgi:SAM-dependent methyltransferase
MDFQETKYNEIYSEDSAKFDIDLPDNKITDGLVPKNKKILVLGVGTARDVRYLIRDNEVWGVDISDQGLKIAGKYLAKTKRIDLNTGLKGIPSNYFDIIVAKEILEHLEDPLLLMAEIRRCLNQSGYAVINVPNHFYLPMRLRMLFGKSIVWKSVGHDHTRIFEEWNYMHKRFFTWKGFKKFIHQSGFRITKEYWDIGTLGHYNQPELVLAYMRIKKANLFLTSALSVGWAITNFIFPRRLRSFVAGLNPGLLSACFYVQIKKRSN